MMTRLLAAVIGFCLLSAGAANAGYRYVPGWGGAPLAVGEWGDPKAPGVLLIHGFGFSSAFWTSELRDRLARRFHVVAFDLRGHGASAKPWEPEAYAGSQPWSADVAAVVKATGLGRPVIVGWSLGGYVAEDYVRDYGQEAVAGVVLVSSPAGFADHTTPKHPAAGLADVLRNQYSLDLDDSLPAKRKLVAVMSAHPLPPEVAASWVAQELQLPPYVKTAMAGARLDNKDLLARQPVTLMLIGDKDETMPEAALRDVAATHPQMSLKVYQGSGHALPNDAPERFLADVEAFAGRAFAAPGPSVTPPAPMAAVSAGPLQAHHDAFSVENADKLAAWYIDVLGFKLAKRAGIPGAQVVWIDIPGFRIGLMQIAGSHRPAAADQAAVGLLQGYRGLVFSVPDVDAYAAYLQGRGVALTSPPTSFTPPGIRIAYFKDPEGNVLAIYQDLDPANALEPLHRVAH